MTGPVFEGAYEQDPERYDTGGYGRKAVQMWLRILEEHPRSQTDPNVCATCGGSLIASKYPRCELTFLAMEHLEKHEAARTAAAQAEQAPKT